MTDHSDGSERELVATGGASVSGNQPSAVITTDSSLLWGIVEEDIQEISINIQDLIPPAVAGAFHQRGRRKPSHACATARRLLDTLKAEREARQPRDPRVSWRKSLK